MHNTRQIVFATVPYTDTQAPLMAPAILKSIASKARYTSATVDLNIKVVRLLRTSEFKNQLINFFHDGRSTVEIEQELFELFQDFAKSLLAYQPEIIGLSLFTYNCQIAAKYLCFTIKKLSPQTKIVLGGAGLTNNLIGKSKFAEALLKHKLINFYIRGDGENALFDYLTSTNETVAGINDSAWKELSNDDLTQLPIPDYDDYDFDDYVFESFKKVHESSAIPILGSRGCVRNCSFCDIHAHWTKFSWRSGEHVFAEMVELNRKYGSRKFMFQDSLNNGNLREFRVLMKLISDWNFANPDNTLRWSSFFILRPSNAFTEEDWKLTASGGGFNLFVGIESLNDEARFHLGKKFTNDDIEFSIQMAVKYGIKLALLFFTGYVTETEDDINFAVQWWKDHAKYKDNLVVNLGTPLGILPGTPLMEQFDDLGLIHTGPAPEDWANPTTGNTPSKRVEWFQRLESTVRQLGYKQTGGSDNRFILERMMRDG